MRVCMLIEAWKPVWGGGQAHVWELANKLVLNHKCSVDVFVMNLDGKRKESFHNGRLSIYRVGRKASFDSFFSRLRWCRDVQKEILWRKSYDVIHAHANLPGWPAKRLSRKLSIPVVYTVHGCGIDAIRDMYGRNLKSWMLSKVELFLQAKIKYSREITVDSSFLKLRNKNKPVVIPNGVNVEKYDAVKAEKAKNIKAIFVGRLHPQKGLKYLIEAVSLIKHEIKSCEFHLIGGGSEEESLKQLAKEKKVDRLFKFRGKVYGGGLIKEYKSSHLFVLPSLYEGQPLTLLEAWAARLPVLVTDVGGNKDFVVEGENGLIVPPKSPKKLGSSLQALLGRSRKELNKMGTAGYQLVKSNYTWDKVAEKTFEVYREALAETQ